MISLPAPPVAFSKLGWRPFLRRRPARRNGDSARAECAVTAFSRDDRVAQSLTRNAISHGQAPWGGAQHAFFRDHRMAAGVRMDETAGGAHQKDAGCRAQDRAQRRRCRRPLSRTSRYRACPASDSLINQWQGARITRSDDARDPCFAIVTGAGACRPSAEVSESAITKMPECFAETP